MGSLVINNDDDDPQSSINAYNPRSEQLEHSANTIFQKFQNLFYTLTQEAEKQQKYLLNYLQFHHGNKGNCCQKNKKYKTTNYHANEKLSCHDTTTTPDNHKLHYNWRSRDDESSIEYSNFIQNYVTTTLLFNYCNYLVNSSSNHNHNRNTLNKHNNSKDNVEAAAEEEAAELATQDLDYIDCNINCNNNDNLNINISRTTNSTTSSTNHHNQQQQQHHHHHQQQQQQYYRSCCTNNSAMSSVGFYAASSFILVLCYLTTLTTALAVDHPIFDESSSDKEILDHLLQKSRYDKRLLPPVNGTLTVNVNVLLLSLASPDESSLKYEVEFLLNQQWTDPRLQYGNKSQYDYLNALHHHDNIWTPDTYFIMHGDFKDPIIPMHFALRIYRNGTITYAMRRHLILSCQGSLHIFPFDDPKCSFSMESISYELSQIKYVWKNDEDTLRKSPSLTSLNAYLIQNKTETCSVKSWRGNYSCLKVDLIFTRDRAYYFTTVFIPGIILVTSSFITFWLEWNAVPARVMIGVTTMLNFFTTSNGFRSTLPVVSNLTAMNVWDGVCMCFIYASLLEFVCVNYVGRKRPLHNVVYRPGENPVTQRLPAVLSRIGVILASPLPGEKKREPGGPNEIVACTSCGGGNSPCTHSANNGCATETCFVQVRKKEPPHPIRVAKTIDVIARITFPTAYAIFLIFFFVHYKGFS
ncbi:pHCl family protein [Megaselia abdita]